MDVESNPSSADTSMNTGETVKFTVAFKKQTFNFERPLNETLSDFRQEVAKQSGVAAGLQKLMYKGMLKDDSKTLRDLGIKDGIKIMLIGSSIEDVMSAATVPPPGTTETKEEKEDTSSEPLSEKPAHKKIIDKGVPEDGTKGNRNRHEPLPSVPLQGIYNNVGTKVRLTFKTFTEELWISSATSTQKVPFASIRSVTSEPIKGNEDYHIVTLQLGASQTSKYYLYFVPAQYTRAIKSTIMSDYLGGY